MKKYILSSFAVALFATSIKAQIPNAGFENWITVGAYENPVGWSTMNNATATNSVYTATKATPGSPGSSFLKLTSKTVNNTVVNGIAVSGKLDTVLLKPISGYAFTGRPAYFTGKFQHMIYGSSQGSVKVMTTRWNAGTSTRDTVAYAEQTLAGMAMSWTNFSMNMTYVDSLNYPDSCLIVLKASGSNPTNNDYLWVDNFAFTGTVAVFVPPVNTDGINENTYNTNYISIFPNPSAEFVKLTLNTHQAEDLSVEVLDLNGKLLRFEIIKTEAGELKSMVNVKDLPAGTYFMKVKGSDFTETKKFIVE